MTTFLLIFLLLQLIIIQECSSINDEETPFPIRNLTYSILNESTKLKPSETLAAFQYAFDQWSAVIPRDFVEIPFNPKKPANIRIKFETGLTDEQFFNSSLISYNSPNGTMYFNDDISFKKYTVGEKMDPEILDFKWIVMHVIGHLLGLKHSFKSESVMHAIYVSTTDSDGRYINPKLAAIKKTKIRWPNRTITFSIFNDSKSLTRNDTKAAFQYAFDQWSAVIPRDFVEIPFNPKKPANIRIKFETGLTDEQFFNSSLISYNSPNGTMYFNDDISFKKYANDEKVNLSKKDITWIAMHTIGHVLGLDDYEKHRSIMYPVYLLSIESDNVYRDQKLTMYDILFVRDIYGPRNY
uniref:Peptidase metallopeptidase domain-containing protein n=1 Tax=Panagrolaimus sp. PS1159 TaxID=55785 RepID=A0AC35FTG6_9BILA